MLNRKLQILIEYVDKNIQNSSVLVKITTFK